MKYRVIEVPDHKEVAKGTSSNIYCRKNTFATVTTVFTTNNMFICR